jgi:hypothetical protein
MAVEDFLRQSISRRTALKAGTATFLASQLALFEELVVTPERPTFAASFSDIQFDIGQFLAPPVTLNDGAGNVVAAFGPVFNLFVPATLNRNPTRTDQTTLANALAAVEANFPTSPAGAFIHVHYGIPYFNRFNQTLVRSKIPRLLIDNNRLALEESPAFPTDVSPANPGITKDRFNVTLTIERNEVLFQTKSDSLDNLVNIFNWFGGSNNLNGHFVLSPNFNNLFNFKDARLQFTQIGLPRKVADANAAKNPKLYEYHTRINPDSPMWMGFLDQQQDASAAAPAVTFVGSSKGVFTNARAGDYFDNGSIAHFSHVIEDLFQFYSLVNQDSRRPEGEPFTERVQYAFRANQLGTADGLPADGNTDQFTDGGGPAYINNVFQGTDSAQREAADAGGVFGPGNATKDATFNGENRVGHIAALQRSSRSTVDGSPLHIRNDGPGFSDQDVPAFQDFPGGTNFPAGTTQPKLQFLVFVPTAEFFRVMRVNTAAQDLQAQFLAGQDDNNGFERFITSTRRQNFLTPPRRHRSFPLVELT